MVVPGMPRGTVCGVAERPGRYSVVLLGACGGDEAPTDYLAPISSTLGHELAHNLGASCGPRSGSTP